MSMDGGSGGLFIGGRCPTVPRPVDARETKGPVESAPGIRLPGAYMEGPPAGHTKPLRWRPAGALVYSPSPILSSHTAGKSAYTKRPRADHHPRLVGAGLLVWYLRLAAPGCSQCIADRSPAAV